MVHEDLKEVLDSNDLLWTQLQVAILLASEVVVSIFVPIEINHSLDYTEGHIANIIHRDGPVIILATLNHRYVGAGCRRSQLLFALLE